MLIKQVNPEQLDPATFKCCCAGCIILTRDRKILLQQRGDNWKNFPGVVSTFGGHIEIDETPTAGLIRELNEELGAKVLEAEVISLGAFTEEITNHTELLYYYFWHDQLGTITGCYEGTTKYYLDIASVLADPKVMPDIPLMLKECQRRGLLD